MHIALLKVTRFQCRVRLCAASHSVESDSLQYDTARSHNEHRISLRKNALTCQTVIENLSRDKVLLFDEKKCPKVS